MLNVSTQHKTDQGEHYWTNKSVLSFAGNEDPIAAMIRRSRSLVLEAIERGWNGPPFDPFSLAELLRIEVLPSQDVMEARTTPFGSRFRIEYNPNRGESRVRYSVAHEIAHTFFPDCAEAIRNRDSYHTGKGDNWQLEMLCNVGAAEVLMPVGSGLLCPANVNDFEQLLDLRKQYKVSTEALLLRMARLCNLQVFAATVEAKTRRPVINYVVSNARSIRPREGASLPAASVVTHCTAIGFTSRGIEKWPSVGSVEVQCVGIPPYPGQVHPRVVGIFREASELTAPSEAGATIEYVRGDATQTRGLGKKIIVQLVNDKAVTWGGGLSLAVRRKWPGMQREFTAWATEGRASLRLGNVHFSKPINDIVVASVVAQAGYGESTKPRIRYNALEQGLIEVAEMARRTEASVHMSRLGCGEAGGSWSIVGELVQSCLNCQGIRVTVYDLPGQTAKTTQPLLPGIALA
jgi:Zn-dependent peptidase ImmA (M78 family)